MPLPSRGTLLSCKQALSVRLRADVRLREVSVSGASTVVLLSLDILTTVSQEKSCTTNQRKRELIRKKMVRR